MASTEMVEFGGGRGQGRPVCFGGRLAFSKGSAIHWTFLIGLGSTVATSRSHNEAAEEGKGIPAMRLQKVRSCMSCHASTPLPLWVQALKCKRGKKRRRRKEVAKAGLGQEN